MSHLRRVTGPANMPRKPAATRSPARSTSTTVMGTPGSKRTLVPAGTASRRPVGRGPVEAQRLVGLGEVEVRADLHRTVAVVDDLQTGQRPALEQHDRLVRHEHLARHDAAARARARLDRVVQRHQLGAVGEGRFDLELLDQVCHAVEHVVGGEHLAAGGHDVGHAAAVTCGFEHPRRQHGDRLGMVQSEATVPSSLGHVGSDMDQQPLLLMG